MHILLIHQAFASLSEPGGTRHYELARCLIEQGHRVTAITSPVSYLTGASTPPVSPEAAKGKAVWLAGEHRHERRLEIIRAYTYPALHRSFVHRVYSFLTFMISSFWNGLNVRDVDLVWGTSPPIFQGLTAWALARLKRVPFLFEVRDLWPAFAVAVGVLTNPVLIRMSEFLERFLLSRADRVVVNSPGFIDHVRAHGAVRVDLIPNGADSSMFHPEATGAAFRARHGLEGKFVALYAGAHGLSNDLFVLLAAADLLRDQPEIAIVLVGDGKEKLALIARASELSLPNVRFLPPVPKSRMGEALAAADVCVGILKPVPLYATVYPNKIFDYMAAGRPIVLVMEGVIKKVVEEAGAGIAVQPGNPAALAEAIRRLAADPKTCRAMGLAGRETVEARFERRALAEKMIQVVEELVKKNT